MFGYIKGVSEFLWKYNLSWIIWALVAIGILAIAWILIRQLKTGKKWD